MLQLRELVYTYDDDAKNQVVVLPPTESVGLVLVLVVDGQLH